MLDIGMGELLIIAVLALLIFGPDKLPRAAADAARILRQIRQAAVSARRDLVDASGLRDDPELMRAMRDIRDLDPRRAMSGALDDEPRASARGHGQATRPASGTGAPGVATGGAGATAASSGAGGAAGPRGGAAAGIPAPAGGDGAGGPASAAQPVVPDVDPDWT